MAFIIIGYLILSFLVALLARRTKLGFFRGFLFSFMFTPLILLIFLLILGSLEADGRKTDAIQPSSPPDC